jgi:hypothetical protein
MKPQIKAATYITVDKDGHILEMHDASHPVPLQDNQVAVTDQELALIRLVHGKLGDVYDIIHHIHAKIFVRTIEMS